MATATPTARPIKTRPVPEQRFLIRGVGWEGYETLLALLGDRPIRLTYDRGDVELVSPSQDHECFKTRLGRLVETLTMELDELVDWLHRADEMGQTAWIRQFREWVREELAPRLTGPE
jgi:hypothetical protein